MGHWNSKVTIVISVSFLFPFYEPEGQHMFLLFGLIVCAMILCFGTLMRVGTCIGKEIGEKDRKLEELITSHLSLLGVH
jgi:hypothetical protein